MHIKKTPTPALASQLQQTYYEVSSSVIIISYVLGLTQAERGALAYIESLQRVGRSGWCQSSIGYIASVIGISRENTGLAIKTLEEKKLIKREKNELQSHGFKAMYRFQTENLETIASELLTCDVTSLDM